MIKFNSLISALIIMMSCNNPEINHKLIIVENKDSAVYSSPFTAIEKGKAQCELVSLIGDIGLFEGTPTVHAHFSVGFETGAVEGGHLIDAVTFPTVELFITVFPVALDKELDPDTDLKLFHPEIHTDSPQK